MLLGDVADTMMNLGTFAFIGAMVWIYAREARGG